MFDIWNVIHAHVLHYLVSYGGDILCTVASLGCPAHHQQGGQGPQHLSSPHQGRDGNGKLSRCASDSRRDSPGHKVSADNLQMSPDFHPKKMSKHLLDWACWTCWIEPTAQPPPPWRPPLAASTCRGRFLNDFRDSWKSSSRGWRPSPATTRTKPVGTCPAIMRIGDQDRYHGTKHG